MTNEKTLENLLWKKFNTNSKHSPKLINDDGVLLLNNQTRYYDLSSLSDKFGIDENIMEKILHPYQSEGWVIYLKEDNEMIPFFRITESRRVLSKHGMEIKTTGIKPKKPVHRKEIKTKSKDKNVSHSLDHKIEIEEKMYAIPAYWAKNIGLGKDKFSTNLKELELLNNENVKELGEKKYDIRKLETYEGQFTKINFWYIPAEVAQVVVNRTPSVRVDEDSMIKPKNNGEEYKTLIDWFAELRPERMVGHGPGNSFSSYFRKIIYEKPSFIDGFEGVNFKVYRESDAKEAVLETIPIIEKKFPDVKE